MSIAPRLLSYEPPCQRDPRAPASPVGLLRDAIQDAAAITAAEDHRARARPRRRHARCYRDLERIECRRAFHRRRNRDDVVLPRIVGWSRLPSPCASRRPARRADVRHVFMLRSSDEVMGDDGDRLGDVEHRVGSLSRSSRSPVHRSLPTGPPIARRRERDKEPTRVANRGCCAPGASFSRPICWAIAVSGAADQAAMAKARERTKSVGNAIANSE